MGWTWNSPKVNFPKNANEFSKKKSHLLDNFMTNARLYKAIRPEGFLTSNYVAFWKKEKNPFFVQNDLYWTHTAKTKHFLVECVLKRPPFIFKIRVCFQINFFTQIPPLYLKSDTKKSKNLLFSKIRHNLNFFQKNLLKSTPQNQKNYEDFGSQIFF